MAEPAILVDSSLWIEGLSPRAPPPLRATLRALIEANQLVVTDMVRLEVIAGARTFQEFREFRTDFEAVRCVPITSREWLRAEDLCVTLGRRGLSVPPADVLIAAVALGHGVSLWHADRDFERIRHVVPALQTFWYPQRSPAVA